jgi:hypothetical protein
VARVLGYRGAVYGVSFMCICVYAGQLRIARAAFCPCMCADGMHAPGFASVGMCVQGPHLLRSLHLTHCRRVLCRSLSLCVLITAAYLCRYSRYPCTAPYTAPPPHSQHCWCLSDCPWHIGVRTHAFLFVSTTIIVPQVHAPCGSERTATRQFHAQQPLIRHLCRCLLGTVSTLLGFSRVWQDLSDVLFWTH